MLACFIATVIWSLFETIIFQFIQLLTYQIEYLLAIIWDNQSLELTVQRSLLDCLAEFFKKDQSLFWKKTCKTTKNGILLKKWNSAHWNEESLFCVWLQEVPGSILTGDNLLLNLCALNYISNTKVTTFANFVYYGKTWNLRVLTWMLRPCVGMFSFDKFCEEKCHKMKHHLIIFTLIFLFIT